MLTTTINPELTPEQAFRRLRVLGSAIWLDSSDVATNKRSRFDIMVADPIATLHIDNVASDNSSRIEGFLQQHLSPNSSPIDELPFQGGAIGYLSYQALNADLRVKPHTGDDISLPEVYIGIFEWALIFDHNSQSITLVALPQTSDATLAKVQRILASESPQPASFATQSQWQGCSSAKQYHRQLKRIDNYIHAGDCYQVNLSQRFTTTYQGDPFEAYCHLRRINPAPFSSFIELDQGAVLSFSPERFIKKSGQQVVTEPIKGTRPRKTDDAEDAQQISALLNSEKDRAENLMIVDLLRNDLGKTGLAGSVRCSSLFELRSFANVHHLVSTVTAQTARSAWQVLSQAFPGGSITGAPKRRAMEIIQELEQVPRSVYCGSIFYISQHGNMDSNIAIRSVVADQQQLHCWGGGAIVADSEAEAEYRESIDKIQLLMDSLRAMNL